MSLTAAPEVIRAEIMQCRVPLPRPVMLGVTEIRFRDYVSVRLVFDDDSEGHATGFERGMPLFEIAVMMARHCIGSSAAWRAGVRHASLGPAPAARPVHARGISLCNIALWDAYSRQLGQPLWAVLGGMRQRLPLIPVIGYGATPERVRAQCEDLASRGFSLIKLMIDGTDPCLDVAMMKSAAGALPAGHRFAIDAHWSWRTVAQALPTCLSAEDCGAAFIEDPFTPSQWRSLADLQLRLSTPIAVGEDVVDRHGFRDLASVAQILRPDASASGGIDAMIEVLALAATHDRSVIPHVFPDLHAHLGFASETVSAVESILPEVGADPIDQFLRERLAIERGSILAPQVPGASTALDWDGLTSFATRTETVT